MTHTVGSVNGSTSQNFSDARTHTHAHTCTHTHTHTHTQPSLNLKMQKDCSLSFVCVCVCVCVCVFELQKVGHSLVESFMEEVVVTDDSAKPCISFFLPPVSLFALSSLCHLLFSLHSIHSSFSIRALSVLSFSQSLNRCAPFSPRSSPDSS